MAPEQKQPSKPEGEAPQTAPPPETAKSKAFVAAHAVPIALAVSILANLVGVFYFRSLAIRAYPVVAQEIPLGNYRFMADEYEPGQVTQAGFALHIELVRQAEPAARRLLEVRRQKVRQNVEELLRTAHSGDFRDPALRGLKGQLQKRINETLEIRAVAEVIVTELQLERAQSQAESGRYREKNVPWVEPAAG